jgi:hypothetical protein
MNTKALLEVIPQEKNSFTNNVNYNSKQNLRTLSKEPRGKTKKWIEHSPKLTREQGRDKPQNIFSLSGIITLQRIDLES